MVNFYQFANRDEAAEALAVKLQEYRGKNPLILAIPRGAVPMGKIIADRLDGQLDVVLVRKLSSSFDPEYAIGAVDESGWTYLSPVVQRLEGHFDLIGQIKARQLDILRKRRAEYTPGRSPIDPEGRIVIVVDDGIATGATMIAALHAVRSRHPAELVCAVPVAPPDSLEHIRPLADKLVCLHVEARFSAVGQFYRNFQQVDDSEVIHLLKQGTASHSVKPGDSL